MNDLPQATIPNNEWIALPPRWLLCAILFCLFYAAVAFLFMGDYGPLPDDAENHYWGDRQLSFVLSGNDQYLDRTLSAIRSSESPHYTPRKWTGAYTEPWRYPGFFLTVSAVSCRIFGEYFHWLPPHQSHRPAVVILGVFTLFLLSIFVGRLFGPPAMLGVFLMLVIQPRWWLEMLTNVKDPPQASMQMLTLIFAFWAAYRNSLPGTVLAGMMWGFGLACKINAFYILPMGLIYYGMLHRRLWWRQRAFSLPFRHLLLGVAFILTGLIAFYVGWPLLWDSLPRYLARYIGYLSHMTNNQSAHFSQQMMHTILPLFCTPLLVLFFVGIAVVAGGRRANPLQKKAFLLLALGAFFPLIRILQPGCPVYDGIRHYIEFVLPMSALAGIGFSQGIGWIKKALAAHRMHMRIGGVCALLILIGGVVDPIWVAMQLHPYQHLYYNRLIHRPEIARSVGLPSVGDYYCLSFYEAMKMVEASAPPGSLVAFLPDRWYESLPDVAGGLRPDLRQVSIDKVKREGRGFVIVCDKGPQPPIWDRLKREGFVEVQRIERLNQPILLILELSVRP